MAQPEFELGLSQQPYLSISDSRMDAILTVTSGELTTGTPAPAAEVIMIDCSGSMGSPVTKLAAARTAAIAAVEALRDGTYFAVLEGTHTAEMCYPERPGMAVVGARTRAEAKERIWAMKAGGGTAIGSWLGLARQLFATAPEANRHAILLTDGKNQHESPEQLDQVLAACAGQFTCDARGIGTDWDPHELRRIVGVLRGGCDAVRVEAELPDDFRALARAAMAKVVPDLRIRVTAVPGVVLCALKQVHPRETDYTGSPARQEGAVWEFSTGSWGGHESRDFQLSLTVSLDDGDPLDEELHCALVELVGDGSDGALAAASVLVRWTIDDVLSSRIDGKVAHYEGQAELAKAMLAGFDAYHGGRHEDAARNWGLAVRLATQSDNAEALTRLLRLVDVVDARNGIVRIKPDVSRGDMHSAATGAGMSSRSGDSFRPDLVDRDAVSLVRAPCGHQVLATATFCGECGDKVNGSVR